MIWMGEVAVHFPIVLVAVSLQITTGERIFLHTKTVGGKGITLRNATIEAVAKDLSPGK
jgi:hypothetical protein